MLQKADEKIPPTNLPEAASQLEELEGMGGFYMEEGNESDSADGDAEETISPLELLMQKAQQQGYLITDDLLSAIPEAEDNMDQLEEVFIQFVNQGIEIYSDAEEAEEERKRLQTAKREEEKLDIEIDPFDLSAIAADDTISLLSARL